jgi:hypothetical protein
MTFSVVIVAKPRTRRSGEGRNPFPFRHSREAGIHPSLLRGSPKSPIVIPAKAGIHFAFALGLSFAAAAKPGSRPCAPRRPSMVAGYFLLLAQKKVTKEKGTLAVAVTRASLPA